MRRFIDLPESSDAALVVDITLYWSVSGPMRGSPRPGRGLHDATDLSTKQHLVLGVRGIVGTSVSLQGAEPRCHDIGWPRWWTTRPDARRPTALMASPGSSHPSRDARMRSGQRPAADPVSPTGGPHLDILGRAEWTPRRPRVDSFVPAGSASSAHPAATGRPAQDVQPGRPAASAGGRTEEVPLREKP